MSLPAIFLDRDGVINKTVTRCGKPTSPRNMDEFEIERGVAESLTRLRAAQFKIFVVTNQPEIARGLLSSDALHLMNEKIMASLPIDGVKLCLHDDSDSCGCRKPKPGMLIDLAREHGLALKSSYLIGDRATDTMAGQAAGCSTIILDRPYNQGHPADRRVTTLKQAAELILKEI